MSNSISCRRRFSGTNRKSGFTLVEILVVIAIVATLATLVFTATRRMKLAAAKTSAINQMRGIGVAATLWAADNSRTEPFYYSNGTGDYPQEFSGGKKTFVPGNPAKLLYNMGDPDSGYLQNPSDFFSPLVKETVPSREDYDPANASPTKPWGTYTWYYPFVSAAERSRYPDIGGGFPAKVNARASGRFLMSECYSFAPPKFEKHIFNALMVDGSIQQVAESEEAFSKWKTGNLLPTSARRPVDTNNPASFLDNPAGNNPETFHSFFIRNVTGNPQSSYLTPISQLT